MTPRRLAIYRDADAATAAVAGATALACPTGCGNCCVRTPPHVSVSDVAPIARAAIESGEAEALLARARATGAGPCVLFAPGRLPGGCTVYALRPVICRLFAFAAVRDKHGALELAICREHKAADPAAPDRVRAYLAAGGAAPVFAEVQQEAHDPDDGPPELMPINLALARALERELLRNQYR
ncbi:MAG TPA: YkgJ family cysteine cluster protein [Kofleriaceae bacterium]|nr:YkgJ family cysteine cluster protein [Kofleriaceae bacterium]